MNSNSFKEVANEAGIEWSRHKGKESFSIAWLDSNNDGLLDLWISGHGYNGASTQYPDGKYPYLYQNNGDGTFTNIFDQDWRNGAGGDVHGTTWIDFDNDGDQDFFAAGGGKLGDTSEVDLDLLSNKFFINNNGVLENEAAARGLENAIARSRSSVWFDGNNDGLLDVVVTTALREDDQGYTAYFEQQANGTFVDKTTEVGLDVDGSSRYAQLGDLTGDGNLDLIIQGTYSWPLGVYDFSSGDTFVEVTNVVPQLNYTPADPSFDFEDHDSARDSIIADFNNDGRNEVFLTRSHVFTAEPSIFQGSDTIVSADLVLQTGGEIGISFKTDGVFALDSFGFSGRDASYAGFDASNIFIGTEGRAPTEAELAAIFNSGYNLNLTSGSDACVFCGGDHSGHNHSSAAFQLDPNDNSVIGLKSDRSARGIYVGFDPSNNTWEVRLFSPENELVRIAVESDQAITEYTEINFTSGDPNNLALSDQFLVYDDTTGEYLDRADEVGLGDPTLAQSAVSGDFNNDGHLDIYVANAYPSFNQPNILYQNQGDGTFLKIEVAGGASSSEVGPHRLDFEVGQRLAVADYDNDGFLDIFAGSTTAKSPRKTYLGAPSQLFHNEEGINGNTNKWVQIDLQGVQSNRDAIGARVLVTTADGVTQVREQNGGMHVFAQNTSRLHFGLGTNEIVAEIEVQWPSGETSIFSNVEPNQILKIVETFPNIIIGDDNANNLEGTDDKDHIIGLGDRDVLNGGSNNDSLDGGNNDDILSGGSGHDSLNGNEGHDTLHGNAGNDLLNGEAGNDLLNGNDGADTIYGGAGDDTINGNQLRDRILGGQGNDSLSGGDGHDYVEGGDDNDTINGNAGNDTLVGGDQDDVIRGGEDGDLIKGGNGNDNLNGENGRDLLEGASGNDLINGGEGADTLDGGDGDDELLGEGGFDSIVGGAGNDTIRGGNGDDTLDGGNGVDTLVEINNSDFILTNTTLIARGNDEISGFEIADLHGGENNNLMDASAVTEIKVIFEGAVGNDTIIGGTQDDTLRGLNDADSLRGENGNDLLEGGSGNDTLIGGNGNDILTGGLGNDQFVFNSLGESTDTITDFSTADDLLVFSASGFDNTVASESVLSEAQFTVGTSASSADQRFVYDNSNGNLFFDADGNGAANQALVANLSNNPSLTHDDIYIAV
ncbi:Ca2+-binding protein, RTX toxin [Xenococcus sp. PCC 7305]|uniref:FG-GAP-like repeat-containing protein n=1 Tax=Xenococcus sp. PCC 7305 TaxID=102125 RepID=UPI0002ACB68C|nr:CRTAC homolog protein [Xenococcus sp. PCC 7305]ELS03435.1 Ca2+-binding protein, RTX toxin [Xenococcus sp. PCC 7305]